MRYAFIRENAQQWPIFRMCDVLEVSRAGYYAWRSRPTSRRAVVHRELLARIKGVHKQSRGTYGSPRIRVQLSREGAQHSRKLIARLMRQNGVRARKGRRFKVVTTDSGHAFPVAPNLVNRRFAPEHNEVDRTWISDITYVPTGEGFLYLAIVMDLRSREIVGWSMHPTRDTVIIVDALQMAMAHRRPKAGLVFHSDRGVQYASSRFRELLHSHGIVQSMSGKGNCWDNAVAESFFSTLKTELDGARRFKTRDAARAAIFEFIAVWYNRQRLHSAINHRTPASIGRDPAAA